MESHNQDLQKSTIKLLDRIYPSGYKIIPNHSYDSNCAGWIAHRLIPNVYKYDDEEFNPRALFNKQSSSRFKYASEINILGLSTEEIENLKYKFNPLQVLGLTTESGKMVHVLLYDPEEDNQLPYESKHQAGSGEFGGNNPPTRNASLSDQIGFMEELAGEKISFIELFELKKDL